MSLDIFFPPDGEIKDSPAFDKALGICDGCSVKVECLKTELKAAPPGQAYGVFGGVKPSYRRKWREVSLNGV